MRMDTGMQLPENHREDGLNPRDKAGKFPPSQAGGLDPKRVNGIDSCELGKTTNE